MTMTRFAIPIAVFVALVALLGVGLKLDPREVPSPLIGKPAPHFELPQLRETTKTFTERDMRGKGLGLICHLLKALCARDVPVLTNQKVDGLAFENKRVTGVVMKSGKTITARKGVIVATGGASSALAAKAATSSIPIVFSSGDDPVRRGIVASLARPGGNLTGINLLVVELSGKRLELLRELVPGPARVAVLVNPVEAANTEITLRDVEAAARGLGLQIQVLKADTSDEINAAFESIGRERPDALFVAATPFFVARRTHLAQRAAFHRLPTAYPLRDFVEAGGLMSYGSSLADAYRQVGAYTGRISRARILRTCRSCRRPSSSLSLIGRPQRCSAPPCRRRCSPAQTR